LVAYLSVLRFRLGRANRTAPHPAARQASTSGNAPYTPPQRARLLTDQTGGGGRSIEKVRRWRRIWHGRRDSRLSIRSMAPAHAPWWMGWTDRPICETVNHLFG